MLKKNASTPAGNAAKHFSYREAFGRIKGSIAHGYYLEAVTLEESIISDRISSYLVIVGEAESDSKLERESFAKLITRWRGCVPKSIVDDHFCDLQISVDEWRNRRNKIVGYGAERVVARKGCRFLNLETHAREGTRKQAGI
jgi:hypothetical protein